MLNGPASRRCQWGKERRHQENQGRTCDYGQLRLQPQRPTEAQNTGRPGYSAWRLWPVACTDRVWLERRRVRPVSIQVACILTLWKRVRAKIRNNEDGYVLGGNYFITCLYPKGHADPELVERGFLRSRLLLQVRLVSNLFTYTDFLRSIAQSLHHRRHRKDLTTKMLMVLLVKNTDLEDRRMPQRATLRPFSIWMERWLAAQLHMLQLWYILAYCWRFATDK